MNYENLVKNEYGEFKVINNLGDEKYFSLVLIQNKQLMKDGNWSTIEKAVFAPIVDEGAIKPIEDYTKQDIVDLLKGRAEFNPASKKEELYNILLTLKTN